MLRLLTTIGEPAPLLLRVVPPSLLAQVAVKLVTAEPLSVPGVNATLADPLPRVTAPIVGAPGTTSGDVDADAGLFALSPRPFVAFTTHVYALALVSELTTMGEEPPVLFPGLPPLLLVQVAVYSEIGSPFAAGAEKATLIWLSPCVNVGAAGVLGADAATNWFDAADSLLLPTVFVAWTVNV